MRNFKLSPLAVLIGVSLTLPAAFAADNQDFITTNTKSVQFSESQATVSGMKNQVDSDKGHTTFAWAPVGMAQPNINAVAEESQLEYAASFYLDALTGAVSKGESAGMKPVMVSSYTDKDGVKIAKFRQELQGVEVFNKEYNVLMDAEFNLVAGSGSLASAPQANSKALFAADFGQASSAIQHAFTAAGGNGDQLTVTENSADDKYTRFSAQANGEVKVLGEPRAKPVYFEKKGKLLAAHYVELETSNDDATDSDYYSYVIAADTGEVLFKNNLKAHASAFNYRIYASDKGVPWDGPHGNVIPATSADQVDATKYLDAPLVALKHGPISKQDPWLADDATQTKGNNVFAYVDAIAPDGFTAGDYAADVTSAQTFDYKYNTAEPEMSMNNRKASIVNLFYMNNYLHDWFYDYGFDEKAGNAQAKNFDRGGVEGDILRAEVQDNSGFDNANMSTPADGGSPRMQMYLWASKDATFGKDLGITASATDGTSLPISAMQGASFGPGQFSLQAQAVNFVDTAAPLADGCTAAATPANIAGKIAVIDRGTCTFTVKAKNAQDAGAKGVIIVNNSAAGLPGMGGTDATVTIPAVGISQAEGNAIKAALTAGKTVNINMFNNKPYKDSSWDNAIVAHEWGHYISNRLVGNGNGLYNNQGRSMGEGWGDFHALLTVSDADDLKLEGNDKLQRPYAAVSYVASFYDGIRAYPYATSLTLNPRTFKHIGLGANPFSAAGQSGEAEVHSAGEIWAEVLWHGFTNLVNYHKDYNKAKDRMMSYLVNGYKMTPVGPTYTEARDAVLAAAYAKDPEDYKQLLKAFADRGMGLGAVSPNRDDPKHTGVVESFKTELSTFDVMSHSVNNNYDDATDGFCTANDMLDNGETGTVQFKLTNRGSNVLKGLKGKVEVVSGHKVTFENGGVVQLPEIGVMSSGNTAPVKFKLEGAQPGDVLELKLSFPDIDPAIVTSEYNLEQRVNLAFVEQAPSNMQSIDKAENFANLNNFKERILVGGDLAKDTRVLDNTNAAFFRSRGHDVGQQYMLIQNNGFTSDVVYETKPFNVGYAGDFSLSFWHYFQLEAGYDGGVIEISVNGGDWMDVTKVQKGGTATAPVYAAFSNGGYNGTLSELLPGRKTFTGNADATFGHNEAINFGTALNGNQVRFRFRVVSDSNTADAGWFVDNIKFNNITSAVYSDVVAGDAVSCDNRTPKFTSVTTSAAKGVEKQVLTLTAAATDRDANQTLTYNWTQLSGTAATIANKDKAVASITLPTPAKVADDLMFEVQVSDGKATVKSTVAVKVENRAPVLSSATTSAASVTEGDTFTATAVGTDADTGDKLTYSWTQVSGPRVTFDKTTAAAVSVTPTVIGLHTPTENVVLKVTLSDGKESTSKEVTVAVNDLPEKSGGSTGLLGLLLLPLAMLRRQRRK